jgi:hypothetical protein
MQVVTTRVSAACIAMLTYSGLFLQACQQTPAASEDCPPDVQADLFGEPDDWRDSVEELIREAPPDSLVIVTFGELKVPKDEFTAIVEDGGGEVIHVFSFNAVAARIAVRFLEDLYHRDDLYGYIDIGRADTDVLLGEGNTGC